MDSIHGWLGIACFIKLWSDFRLSLKLFAISYVILHAYTWYDVPILKLYGFGFRRLDRHLKMTKCGFHFRHTNQRLFLLLYIISQPSFSRNTCKAACSPNIYFHAIDLRCITECKHSKVLFVNNTSIHDQTTALLPIVAGDLYRVPCVRTIDVRAFTYMNKVFRPLTRNGIEKKLNRARFTWLTLFDSIGVTKIVFQDRMELSKLLQK